MREDIADRVEIEALRGEFTDAATQGDFERFEGLFTEDARLAIPEAGILFRTRGEIRAGIERLREVWEFLIQHAHPGTVRVDGDTATGRSYVYEVGRFRDGRAHLNYGIYHDEYRRAGDGWKFASRVYEVLYLDETPLAGAARDRAPGPGQAATSG
jgi:ketosteroid isomerase-like protein